jgi:hypothetical protein
MKHRKEEDELYRKFARARDEEDKRMTNEIRASFGFLRVFSALAAAEMRERWLNYFWRRNRKSEASGFVLVVFIDICSVRASSLAR